LLHVGNKAEVAAITEPLESVTTIGTAPTPGATLKRMSKLVEPGGSGGDDALPTATFHPDMAPPDSCRKVRIGTPSSHLRVIATFPNISGLRVGRDGVDGEAKVAAEVAIGVDLAWVLGMPMNSPPSRAVPIPAATSARLSGRMSVPLPGAVEGQGLEEQIARRWR